MRDRNRQEAVSAPSVDVLTKGVHRLPEYARWRAGRLDAWGQAALLQEYGRRKRSLRVAYLLWPLLFLHRPYVRRAMPQPEEPGSAPEPPPWWEYVAQELMELFPPLILILLLVALPVLIWEAALRAGDLLRMHRLVADANHAAALAALKGAEERGEEARRRVGRQQKWATFWA